MGQNTMKAALIAALMMKNKTDDELRQLQTELDTPELREKFAEDLRKQFADDSDGHSVDLPIELSLEIAERLQMHVENKLLMINRT